MPVRRGARGELRLPRGWTALCLLSLLPSGFTNPTNNLTSVAMESSTLGIVSSVSTNVLNQDQDSTTPSGPASTSPHPIPQDSNETTSAISETMVNFTATSGVSPGPETTNSSAKSQTTFSALTVITTADNISTSEMAWMPSTTLVNFSYYSPNSTIPEMTSATESYTFTSSSPVPSTIKGEIKCSGIREMRLAQGICLELSEASSCEEFKKGKGEGLTQILCGKEKANGEVEAGVCSLLLAQSEVKPECLLLLLVNKTAGNPRFQGTRYWEPPELFPKDLDCTSHFRNPAGHLGNYWLFSDEPSQLESHRRKAGRRPLLHGSQWRPGL
uniref:hematopoietic progenitor cell antigen CD34 isoform X4 n=1 Tax=Jaculus jaculus TaxID=51337 RepID=UPI001E1B16F5|nr:hematopoietic progenitor cell antigen CD34 isoform X4 [Jaculus jaculus]